MLLVGQGRIRIVCRGESSPSLYFPSPIPCPFPLSNLLPLPLVNWGLRNFFELYIAVSEFCAFLEEENRLHVMGFVMKNDLK